MSAKHEIRKKTHAMRSLDELDEYTKIVKQLGRDKSFEKNNAEVETSDKKEGAEEHESDGTNFDLKKTLKESGKKEVVPKSVKKLSPAKKTWYKKVVSWKVVWTTVVGAVILGFLSGILFLFKYFISNEIEKRAISGAKINSKNIEYLINNSSSTLEKVNQIQSGVEDIKVLLPVSDKTATYQKNPGVKL